MTSPVPIISHFHLFCIKSGPEFYQNAIKHCHRHRDDHRLLITDTIWPIDRIDTSKNSIDLTQQGLGHHAEGGQEALLRGV